MRCLQSTTIVVASDHQSFVVRCLTLYTDCAVAEIFMHRGKSKKCFVVYDALAAHTMVVEDFSVAPAATCCSCAYPNEAVKLHDALREPDKPIAGSFTDRQKLVKE